MKNITHPELPQTQTTPSDTESIVALQEISAPEAMMTSDVFLDDHIDPPSVSVESAKKGGVRPMLQRAKTAAELAVVAAEVTPANEALRFGAFAAVIADGAPPVVSGLVLGATTLAIEGGAALATADLLRTKTGSKVLEWVNRKMSRIIPEDAKMSPLMEAGVAYAGGSAIVLAEKQRENPSRIFGENVRHGLFTAGWLSGTVAVQGTLIAEGVHTPSPTSIGLGVIGAASVPLAARWARRRGERPETPIDDRTDFHRGREYRIITDEKSLDKAAVIEQQVWDEQGFGNLEQEGYGHHIANSRTIASFKGDECVGVTRLFKGKEDEDEVLLPPFINLPFYDGSLRDFLAQDCVDGIAEELGTTAVVESARGKGVNTRMWRMAYRDAYDRGVRTWAIIMEPERVEKMNNLHGFTFEQVGPAVDYQGGDCAVHIMDLQETRDSMRKSHPLTYYWFTQKSLKSK
jgi:hypothetical protein